MPSEDASDVAQSKLLQHVDHAAENGSISDPTKQAHRASINPCSLSAAHVASENQSSEPSLEHAVQETPVQSPMGERTSATDPVRMADPQLDPETISTLLNMMGPNLSARRFRANDITDSPDLAEAARREMHLLDEGPAQAGDKVRDKLQQQQAAVEAIDADAEDEGAVNHQVAELVVQRLEQGRKSMELLVRLLQGLVAAEAAYASAMQSLVRSLAPALEASGAVGPSPGLSRTSSGKSAGGAGPGSASKNPVAVAQSDDPVVCLVGRLAGLPDTIAHSHRHLQGSLASLTSDCQKLLDQLAGACRRAGPEAVRARARVSAARAALADALATHAHAHRLMAAVLSERSRGIAHRAPDLDPWATEGSLAQAHRALQQAQDQERSFLKQEFRTAQQLEGQRLELSKQAVAMTAGSYRAALLPVQHDLVGLLDLAPNVDTTERLSKLSHAASHASELAEKLAEQQAKSTELVCQELFCSPEIIRQGGMQYLDTPVSRWTQGHFVLTRAGFLHWFRDAHDVEPLGSLCLARCQFEAGTAYCFHVLELQAAGWLVGSRQKRYSLQGPDVDDTCEWAVAIKEAITIACGRTAQ